MTLITASFYADRKGKINRFDEYLEYIRAGKRALERTNPGAQYVVLTDKDTAKKFGNEFDLRVYDNNLPLMLKIIHAQIKFVEESNVDLVVLPDVDCLANKNLDEAIPQNVGVAITHKGPKFHYRINNCAYVRDKALCVWFLKRSYEILLSWPEDKHDWWGDQEAWQSALGVPINGLGYWTVVERLKDEILVARPEKHIIHLYPCATHNCPMTDSGDMKDLQRNAFMVHFKGERKQHLDKWMTERFGK